jgi:hypothetical protein
MINPIGMNLRAIMILNVMPTQRCTRVTRYKAFCESLVYARS